MSEGATFVSERFDLYRSYNLSAGCQSSPPPEIVQSNELNFHQIVGAIKSLQAKDRPSAKDAAWDAAILDKELHGGALKCFGVLLKRLNWKEGFCFPGFGHLAACAKLTRGTVINSIQRLERNGHLLVLRQRKGKANRSNRYTFPNLIRSTSLVHLDIPPAMTAPSLPNSGVDTGLVARAVPEHLRSTIGEMNNSSDAEAYRHKQAGKRSGVFQRERLRETLRAAGLDEDYATFFSEIFMTMKSGKIDHETFAIKIAHAVPNVPADTLRWAADNIITSSSWLPSPVDIINGLKNELQHQAALQPLLLLAAEWKTARPDLAQLQGQPLPPTVLAEFEAWVKERPYDTSGGVYWVKSGTHPPEHSVPSWGDTEKEKKRKAHFEGGRGA